MNIIKLGISINGYNEKPNVAKVKYRDYEIELGEIINLIKNGHVFSALFSDFNSEEYGQKKRTYNNFKGTYMVMVDVDDTEEKTLEELIGKLKIKPTIGYTTFSHGLKGNRYRLMYFFNDIITNIELFKMLYDSIVNENNLKLNDNCGRNPTQAVIGSNSNCQLYSSERIYSVEEFDLNDLKNAEKVVNVKVYKKEEKNIIPLELPLFNKELLIDYYGMNTKEFLDKYLLQYQYFDRTPLEVDDNLPYILLPNNYIEISRYWIKDTVVNPKTDEKTIIVRPKLITNGNRRRYKLFINAVIRRLIKKEIRIEELFINMVYELYYFIDNSDKSDYISKKNLLLIVNSAFKVNLEKYREKLGNKTDKRKFIVNQNYCIEHNITKREARNLSKKIINYSAMASVYDPLLSDKENLNNLEYKGLKVSKKTLYNFKKECNLNKFCKTKINNQINNIKEIDLNIKINKSISTSILYAS